MEKALKEILGFIKKADNFLLTAHINADGDAYASVLAVAYLLEVWGKQYRIVFNDKQPEAKYSFMWGFEKVQSYSPEKDYHFQAAIALDVPSLNRIGDPAKLLPAREFCVKIDHHPQEEDFARYSLVNTRASSTSQLVYELISLSGIALNQELATLLFSGIMYDTGRFSFSNASLRAFQIAADLMRYQVQPSDIANHMFFDNSFQSMKIIGYGLEHMKSYLDGKLCVIYLPRDVSEEDSHSEIEELANYSVSIKNVEVGLFIRQVKPDFFKVSFRSKGRVNVNTIARALGGGGHNHAAGCRFRGDFQTLLSRLIEEVKNNL
ncbi:MAG TPA: bifunctional oligoribonuclease/PAP phosphatase NrnA [Caldithrix sp.]|nr:bifunctional oligoribonuclease/PAP phosphatase NrnA [Caldithrix sp.]